ncbi:MAG TPA: double zinc ribbon domain-containing protein [Gaiellaceae bacterium]
MAWLFDCIFPRSCVSCGAPADLLCAACRERIRVLRPPSCTCCGAPTVWPVARCRECAGRRIAFTTARAAVAYAGPTRALVRAWKERGLRRAAELAVSLVAEHLEAPAADVITPIPPDPRRQLVRAAHPASGLAQGLGERWSLPVEQLLVRTRRVPRQTGLPLAERQRNVRGAFAAAATAPGPLAPGPPRRVILVDDVYTTGATVSAAAAALRAGGAEEVHVVTLARALR